MLFSRSIILLIYFPMVVVSFNLVDYMHYIDYLPNRQEGYWIGAIEDFRTQIAPPSHIRNRKMITDTTAFYDVEGPYGFDDFKPIDFANDKLYSTGQVYIYSQGLLKKDRLHLLPGYILGLPIRPHFIYPKDKLAFTEHMSEYFFDGAKVLELSACHESILPSGFENALTVGVGWDATELEANPLLDDFIEQDFTVDPFLPLADDTFDFVVMPSNFQLLQRPLDSFREINRVLKPGGMAFIGVKLSLWGYLYNKQCRYYIETNYFEDILALGSFFHYSEGFSKPRAFDLTLPEVNPVGTLKDKLFPQPRLDFFACVQAKKRKDSPHGKDTPREPADTISEETGLEFKPKKRENGYIY